MLGCEFTSCNQLQHFPHTYGPYDMDLLTGIASALTSSLHIDPGRQVKSAVKRVEKTVDTPARLEKLGKKTLDRTEARPEKLLKGVKRDVANAKKDLAKGNIHGATRKLEHAVKEPQRQIRGVKTDARKLERAPKQEIRSAQRAVKTLVHAPGREVKAAERKLKRAVRPPRSVQRLLKKRGGGHGHSSAAPVAAGVAVGAAAGVAVGGAAVGVAAVGWAHAAADTIHNGYLLKQGEAAVDAYKKRYFSCAKDSGELKYFSDVMKVKKGTIALRDVTHIVAVTTTPLDLVLVTPSRKWVLRGVSLSETNEWLDLFEAESGVFAYESVEAADADDFVPLADAIPVVDITAVEEVTVAVANAVAPAAEEEAASDVAADATADAVGAPVSVAEEVGAPAEEEVAEGGES